MKIIWSLFDSETAMTQELNSDKYKVYCDRSRVPIELYKHLLDYYEGCGQLVLF